MDRCWYSFHLVSVLAALTAVMIIVALDFPWGCLFRSRPYTCDGLRLGITAVFAGLLILLVLERGIRNSSKSAPSRGLCQFHLSSGVAALVVFGAWMMLNTVPGEVTYGEDDEDEAEETSVVSKHGRVTEYGWPLTSYVLFSPRFAYHGGGRFEPLAPELTMSSLRGVSPLEFLCNALVYCLATVIAFSILERRII
jgi:hypothetical protein